MKKTLFLLVLASCTTMGSHAAAGTKPDDWDDTYPLDGIVGMAYLNSFQAAIDGRYLCCEWPEEYPGSDEPGAAYRESQAAAEDADFYEDNQDDDDQ
jgi:hypothetical protein